MSVNDGSAFGPLYLEGHSWGEVSRDRWVGARGIAARAASILLHVLVISLFFVRVPVTVPTEPEIIPVELVVLPPPEPKPKPKPKVEVPQPPAPLPAPQQVQGESGGSPSLKAGQPSKVDSPRPIEPKSAATAPEAAKPPEPPKSADVPKKVPESAPPLVESAKPPEVQKTVNAPPVPPVPRVESAPFPTPVPKPPAPKLANEAPPASRQPPILPKPSEPSQKALSSGTSAPPQIATLPPAAAGPSAHPESQLTGEGGGDPYLNAMRDDIVANIIYPASAQGTSGGATYELVVDRRGFLLGVQLVRSSGSTALDRAGLDAIQNTAPFHPLPRRIRGNAINIEAYLYISR